MQAGIERERESYNILIFLWSRQKTLNTGVRRLAGFLGWLHVCTLIFIFYH